MYRRFPVFLVLCSLILVLGGTGRADAQEDDEFEEFEDLNGLVATYVDHEGNEFQRIDRTLSFAFDTYPLTEQLAGPVVHAKWSGSLFANTAGEYRLAIHVAGQATLEIDGRVLLDVKEKLPTWHTAALRLEPGDHEIHLVYSRDSGEISAGRLGVYWEGPDFIREPLAGRWITHDSSETTDRLIERGDLIERGRQLVHTAQCAHCHAIAGTPASLAARPLGRVANSLNFSWAVDALTGDEVRNVAAASHKPLIGMSRDEATVVMSYLFAEGDSSQAERPLSRAAPSPKVVQRGKDLLVSLGCLACHTLQGEHESTRRSPYGGGDLTRIADKRPVHFFETWLRDPAAIDASHRMPVFALTGEERLALAAYLQTLKSDVPTTFTAPPWNDEDRDQATRLLEKFRCAACHQGMPTPKLLSGLDDRTAWGDGCLGQEGDRQAAPMFGYSDVDKQAIRAYIESVRASTEVSPATVAQRRLVELGCIACHDREEHTGLSPVALAVAHRHEEWASRVAALIPPSLNAIGDKLHEEAIAESVLQGAPIVDKVNETGNLAAGRRRPWLDVRMPRYALGQSEANELARAFIRQDRIPPFEEQPDSDGLGAKKSGAEVIDQASLEYAGSRLVSTSGLGCTSCHGIGNAIPADAPLNSRGPELSEIGGRVRRKWFDRWVRDPLRLVPRVEMPAVRMPVAGVLHGDLDRQLDAVWQVLNQPGFNPPRPGAVRVVRKSGIREDREAATVLTGVLRRETDTLVKPFLVGLPNRHNILYDLDRARLVAWWMGDAASQRNEGKVWYWETPPQAVLEVGCAESDISVLSNDQTLIPLRIGPFVSEPDVWRHADGQVILSHRLQLGVKPSAANRPPGDDALAAKPLHTALLEQTFAPRWLGEGTSQGNLEQESGHGWRRTLRIRRLPEDAQVHLVIARPGSVVVEIARDQKTATWQEATQVSVHVISSGSRIEMRDGAIRVVSSTEADEAEVVLDYRVHWQPDVFPSAPESAPHEVVKALNVAPGFITERLALPNEMMPTGIDFDREGAMMIASLKGRVWRAVDTNGDGLHDSAWVFSDELGTPYGIAAGTGHTDVVTKYGVVRLRDRNGDGLADEYVLVASGWGHTDDYHDWAVGLPPDGRGGYWVALPCQQDQRSEAAAHLRGTVLHLQPRSPSPESPRQFALEVLTRGHRFPMGIAQQATGELFVTDNQGNYNPFNELNHILPGRRYGFINAIERASRIPSEHELPAVAIPHPWTRSVNGICFLEIRGGTDEQNRAAFGPFAGHLVGCEYDTQRLIRLSLQPVGETFQGAAYPLTWTPSKDDDALLGPIVIHVDALGQLFVGNIRDAGWGLGPNIGSIARMRFDEQALPAGIAEVVARPRGFVVRFTRPVQPDLAGDVGNYTVVSYRRVSTPKYGGEDLQRRTETIVAARVDDQQMSVHLDLAEMRPGFVYELHCRPLVTAGETFFPSEAYYTLNVVPPLF
ncbi:MAG: c-type cytochrome [Planctomycetales bacterium]|nr:c-type cytochrome [Planctomycetales bacterium]